MQFKEKYNESCIKIFNLLSLLCEDKANYDEVLKALSDDIHEATPVIINKYLNTLKIFGIETFKNKNKFHILSTPFPINLTEDDLRALNIIESIIATLPQGKTVKYSDLIPDLEISQ